MINSSNMNPNWAPPPPKPGMSGGAKILIGVSIGCGLIMLVCCAGLAGFGLYMQSWLRKGISSDKVTVRQMTARIAKIDVPAGLEPTNAFELKELWGKDIGKMAPNFVLYRDEATDSQLILVSMVGGPPVRDRRQLRNQVEGMLQQGEPADGEDLQVEKTSSKEVKIGDQDVTFTITQGKSPSTGKPRIQASGQFEGNRGQVVLLLSVDADKYPEETVIKTLESIQVDAKKTDRPAADSDAGRPAAPKPPRETSAPKS